MIFDLIYFLYFCTILLYLQGSPSLVLEGRCPVEFSSNPNQTHLKQLINDLLGILEGVLRQVGAKLCRTPALQDQV